MNTFSNVFFLSCIIGWANFEPPQGQDFIEFFLSLEGARAEREAPTEMEKEVIRSFFRTKDSLLERIFSSGDFSYLNPPHRVNKNSQKENLIGLIDKDKIISSFRVQTLHNILAEGIAMLELS